ncbi:MAG TPA: hypothetical protein VFF02_01955 [Anaeromyxobacteraceae bacterium]|jgi:hypothetical protein|nr:hypothetical protein [Anaeromyxobacteraceae bacterium]
MNVKGSALIHGLAWIEERYGHEAVTRYRSGLDEAARETMRHPLHGHGWYPVHVWNAMAEAVAAAGGLEALRDFAREVAQRDLSLPYRVLLSVGSPTTLFKRAGLLWTKYFDGGVFETIPEADNRFRHFLRAGVDPVRDPARLTCEVAIPAWQEGSLALAGARNGVSRHLKCRFDGQPACEFLVTWD